MRKAQIFDHVRFDFDIIIGLGQFLMFAVPGWALSSSSLVQEGNRSSTAQRANASKTSKKRKRDHDIAKDQRPIESKRPLTTEGEKAFTKPRNGLGTRKEASVPVKQQSNQNPATSPHDDRDDSDASNEPSAEPGLRTIPALPASVKLTPLQAKMKSKLTSARFRHLNETLYTTSSNDALALFTKSPELFAEYHAGFSQQVKDSWPRNPVEDYIKSIRMRGVLLDPKQGLLPLPRRKTGSCTIADLGCGDAPLARGCQSVVKSMKLKFHNYDLHASNSFITKADISNLPLRDGEADIVVFCLSLMGTNWVNFVEEAWRVLRGDGKGEVWVAEVKSRFGKVIKGRVVENSVGKRRKKSKTKSNQDDDADAERYDAPEQFVEVAHDADTPDDETDVSNFVKVFTRRGFQLKEGSVDKNNKMFVSMVFYKTGIPTAGKHKGLKWNGKEYVKQADPKPRFVKGQKDDEEMSPLDEARTLKPCVYKIR